MATDRMKERFNELEALARAAGLRHYDVQFFEVPSSVIYEVASYGLPTRYSHWSFGKVYQYQKTQGEMGFSKIYELILNNNPSYAFLDTTNTDTINLMICAHCYLPGTYVQTTKGIKLIEDIKSYDKVFTHTGSEELVVAPTYNIFEGDVITIQAGSYTFTQTADHQLYVVRTNPKDRTKYRSWQNAFNSLDYSPEWVEAGNIGLGDFLVVNKPNIGRGFIKSETIPIKKVLWRQDIDEKLEVKLDEDFGELVGLYLAEGYARPKGQMGLCFHRNETELHSRSEELIAKCFNLKSRTKFSSSQAAATVEFNEICIAEFLRQKLGHSCYEKALPRHWLDASVDFLRGVLKGFLLGDGTKTQSRTMGYTTTSSLLAMQIQQIGMRLGIYFGVNPRDKSTENQPRHISFDGLACGIYDNKVRKLLNMPEREISRSWSGIIEDDEKFYVKVNSISSEEYSGIVHCMKVERNDSFTLANGIITHNCLAHSDFFANNVMFKEADEQNMVQVAKRHAEVIEQYRKDYGDDAVDEWLDVALALERHIDVYKTRRRDRYPVRHIEYKERTAGEWEDLVPSKTPLVKRIVEGEHVPPYPEKDLLWFLSEYSNFELWQKHIFEIVRRESYYFYPQFKTKIINEGWASYWHAELMHQYALGDKNDYGVSIKYPLSSEEHLDFLASHEKVVQPGLKMPLKVDSNELDAYGRPTGRRIKVWNRRIVDNPNLFYYATRINPYYVGFRLFRDIKERWDSYYKKGYMEDEWGTRIPVTIDGAAKIREVMMSEDDVSLFRNYLTEKLCDELHLFSYGSPDNYKDDFDIQESSQKQERKQKDDQYYVNKALQVRTKSAKDVIDTLANSKKNYGVPLINIRRIDSDGTLRLEHVSDDKVNIDIHFGEHVLKYVFKAWGRPVELVRKGPKYTHIMRYDNNGFILDHENLDYPECVENNDVPSSW